MRCAHENTLHSGAAYTLAYVRNQFWIINGRNAVRFFIRRCVICAFHAAKCSEQLMGNLPAPRVNKALCFQHVGIDFAGPLEIKASKLRNSQMTKVYIALFECMCTKAVHLETVLDLSSAGFIAAFKKFVARRGLCTDVYVDNARNHIGASNELPRLLQDACSQMSKDVVNELLKDDIAFHFIPPRTPNFGGLWEASIKTMKGHLKRQLGNHKFTYNELNLILCQIEACMNSRPLCTMSNEDNDIEILTPAHVLIGRSINTVPEPMLLEENENRLSRYQRAQRVYQAFWALWSRQYLDQLQKRSKWNDKRENIKSGDVVILREANLPPCKWLKAVVINVFPGSDGLVRVVEVKTQTGIFRRGIQQICRLPVHED